MEWNMSQLKAIPTTYKGVQYRSRLEARWVVFFAHSRIPFKYEPDGVQTPDFIFYLREAWWRLEVKGEVVNTDYYEHLRGCSVNILGIGGFWKQQAPRLISVVSEKEISFYRFFDFEGVISSVNAACQFRFDLRS
jgi:hypothetical protein